MNNFHKQDMFFISIDLYLMLNLQLFYYIDSNREKLISFSLAWHQVGLISENKKWYLLVIKYVKDILKSALDR